MLKFSLKATIQFIYLIRLCRITLLKTAEFGTDMLPRVCNSLHASVKFELCHCVHDRRWPKQNHHEDSFLWSTTTEFNWNSQWRNKFPFGSNCITRYSKYRERLKSHQEVKSFLTKSSSGQKVPKGQFSGLLENKNNMCIHSKVIIEFNSSAFFWGYLTSQVKIYRK